MNTLCAGLKRRHDDCSPSFHGAALLAHTSGSTWAYQPSPLNAEKIYTGLHNLAVAWAAASADKSMRPVFAVASGPGTGKSRLLDEFPSSCRTAAADNTELAAQLARAYVFKVSFENGTPYDPDVEGALSGDVVIGTRMMRQLTDTTDLTFPAFRSRNSCTIDDALLALAKITGTPREKQVVFLLVDGMQKLLPMPQDRTVCPPDPVQFRSAINAVSACVNGYPERVVGAIAATLTLPIERVFGSAVAEGSQQYRIYLLPPPLARPEDVVHDVPGMPLLRILRADMGGHGRALEILAQHLYDPFGGLRPFASVAADTLSDISMRYRSWTSTEGVQEIHEPLLRAVVARRRLRLTDTLPGCSSPYWTVDKVCSLGLVRLATTEPGQSGHLEMAVILLQLMRRELCMSPLTSLVPDYTCLESSDRVAKTWQDFEDFVANFRAIKVAAFQDMASVLLSELHAGAQLSADAAATAVRVPPGPGGGVRVIHSTVQYSTATLPLDAHSLGVTDASAALQDVVLNGASASAGDIFLRLDRLERSSGLFAPALEVMACRHRRENVNAMAFDCELDKAIGDRRSTSFFLFVTSARVIVDFGASSAAQLEQSDGSGGGVAASERQTRSVAVSRLVTCPSRVMGSSCRGSPLRSAGRPGPCRSSSAPRRRACGIY